MAYNGIIFAGQSNCVGYGEGAWDNETYDKIFPRNPHLNQLARDVEVTPGGQACQPNTIIPMTHCPHNVQYLKEPNNPAVGPNPKCFGVVSAQYHVLNTLHQNYFWQNLCAISCARGGAGVASGTDATYVPNTIQGTTSAMSLWSVTKGTNTRGSDTKLSALYLDLLDRTVAFMQLDPQNKIRAMVWLQGENDMGKSDSAASHRKEFGLLIDKFKTDLKTALGDRYEDFPIITPATTRYWKDRTNYGQVWATYQTPSIPNLYFVDIPNDLGATNEPTDDPDTPGYYGAGHRTSATWLSSARPSHFSSKANVHHIGPMIAGAIDRAIKNMRALKTIQIDDWVTQAYTKKDTLSPQVVDLPAGTIVARASDGKLVPWTFTLNSVMYALATKVPAGTTDVTVVYHGKIPRSQLRLFGGSMESNAGTTSSLNTFVTFSKLILT